METLIFKIRKRYLLAVLMALMLIKTGIGMPGNWAAIFPLTQNPFENPFLDTPNAQYLLWNWLGPFLMWCLGISQNIGIFLFYFAFSLLFSALFFYTVWRLLPDAIARVAIVVFFLFPVAHTAYFWVFMDSLTLFLMLAPFALYHKWGEGVFIPLIFGVFLGMQHFEQAFLGVAALNFATFCHRKKIKLPFSCLFCFLFLIGILFGKIILIAIFEYCGIQALGRFSVLDFIARLQDFFLNFQWALWSGLGLGWLVVFNIFKFKNIAFVFLITLLPLVFLPVVAMDYTRVVAIATFPLLLQYVFLNAEFLASISKKTLRLLFLVWVLMPCVWFYITPRISLLPVNMAYFVSEVFGVSLLPWEVLSNNLTF